MSLFIESIKVSNGIIYNAELHQERVNRTLSAFYPESRINLSTITIPEKFSTGLFKLRIIYSGKIEKYEFLPYKMKTIRSLKIINADTLNYEHKYLERTAINRLFSKRENCDDILIVRNGLVTDTSYCNVIFDDGSKLYTPINPLLKGTKRELLIRNGIIEPSEIKIDDLNNFKKVILINSMLDLEDKMYVDISNIV